MICCDEQRIMQVLVGLQSNAIKFTQTGFIKTTIEIVFDEVSQDKFLEVKVIDTGIGIAKQDQDKLFKLFGFV